MLPLLPYMYGMLVILFIMFIFSVIGKGFVLKAGFNCNSLTAGFLLSSAIFYILAFPFMITHGSLILLAVLYAVCMCIVFGRSLYICYKRKKYAGTFSFMRMKNNPFFIISVILGIIIIVLLAVLRHSDADDSFYIAQSSAMLESGRINPYEQSTGITTFPDCTQYSLVGYEIWTAVICLIFNINTAVLYHSLLPVILIIMHFLVMYDIGKALFKDKASVFLILIMCFDFLGGYSVYSQGAFAMLRLWQGKAVLINIIMPFLMLIFIKILRQGYGSKYDKIMLYCILLSGLFISVVGLYIIPLEYALFFTVFSIYMLIRRRGIKEIFMLTIPVICILPFVAFYLYILLSGGIVQDAAGNADKLSYIGILRSINGTGIILPVFVICAVFFALHNNKTEKYIFGLYPLVCMCTVANPLICRYVAAYITGTTVYWRIFWLLQFNITICAAIMEVYEHVKKHKAVYITAAALTIILCGKPIFTKEFFKTADNFEKIDVITKNTADVILEREYMPKSLVMPEEYGYGIRQYSGKIIMIWSRYSHSYYKKEGVYDRIKEVYDLMYEKRIFNKYIYDSLRNFNTDYVLLYKDTLIDDDVDVMSEFVYEYGDFMLYKIS